MAKLVTGVKTVTVSSIRVRTATKYKTTDGKLHPNASVANIKQSSLNRRAKSNAIRNFLAANGVATGSGYQLSPAAFANALKSPRFVSGLSRIARA